MAAPSLRIIQIMSLELTIFHFSFVIFHLSSRRRRFPKLASHFKRHRALRRGPLGQAMTNEK